MVKGKVEGVDIVVKGIVDDVPFVGAMRLVFNKIDEDSPVLSVGIELYASTYSKSNKYSIFNPNDLAYPDHLSIYIYKEECLFVCLSVLYAFSPCNS